MNRLTVTVTLTDREIRDLLRLGSLAAGHNLSLHGQTALARLTTRIAERVENVDVVGGVAR